LVQQYSIIAAADLNQKQRALGVMGLIASALKLVRFCGRNLTDFCFATDFVRRSDGKQPLTSARSKAIDRDLETASRA
jgi:hypothetical protein